MANATESNKTLARKLARVFGGKPLVSRYWDEAERSHVDILLCEDAPSPGVVSLATIGLSDHPLVEEGKDIGVRAELVSAFGASFEEGANIVSTAAFCVINSGWKLRPGAVFPDVVRMFRSCGEMRHLLFTPPFLWEGLTTEELEDKTVAWLMAVPISENECRFAEQNGSSALEDQFVKHQIDVFDLNRASVL
jgi:hypothetical protein